MQPAESQPLSDRRLALPAVPLILREHADASAAAVLALVGAPYLLLLKSPLRLAGDEIAYLSLGARMAGGFPDLPFPPGAIDYPRGYPAVLAALDRLGLGVPWAFVGLNLVLLAIGIAATYVLLRRVFRFGAAASTIVCSLTLLSRVIVWTAAGALTDVPFFALAMLCLLLLGLSRRAAPRRAWPAIAAATLLAAAALELRTIGVALLPAVLFGVASRPEAGAWWRKLRAKPTLAAAVAAVTAAVVIGAGVLAVSGTGYWAATKKGWRVDAGVGAVAGQAAHELKAEFRTVGELALNINHDRAPAGTWPLFVIVGLAAGTLVAFGVRARRRRLEAVDVYAASLAITLFLWPGNDARLWLPALPILLAYGALALRRYRSSIAVSAATLAFVVAFGTIGAFTLARSASISFAGSRFPEVWADTAPWTEPTYRLAFDPRATVDRREVRRRVLLLLRRYEPLAQH
jgi:hypothetical protein